MRSLRRGKSPHITMKQARPRGLQKQPAFALTGRRRAACAAKKLSCASLTCSSSSLPVGSVAWHCRQRTRTQ